MRSLWCEACRDIGACTWGLEPNCELKMWQQLREGFMQGYNVRVHARLAMLALLAVTALAGSAHGQSAVPDISGTYWANEYRAKVPVIDGGGLPLTAKGKAAYATNIAG